LVKVIESGPADIRIALLGVCSGLSEPQLRPGLRHAVADSNPAVRAAAIRALCDTHDLELLPDALKVATSAPEAKFRALATAACVRLTSQEEGARLPNEVRLAPMKTLLAGHPSAAEKRMVLAGLAEIPDAQALSLSEALLGDPGVQAEAARTVIKIAPTVADTSLATGALKKVLGMTGNSGTLEAAQAALKQIQARSDWVTSWEAAGPYRQTGKDYAALFDITFVPEQTLERKPQGPGGSNSDTTPVNWQPLPPGLDPAHPGVMDLLKQYGGEQCVAYAGTWIYSPAKQSALLDLGTDDGVKVWLNERLVHGKNVARPLLPGSDKVELNLNEGWNDLLLKVTQNNLGWEFCARVLKPDGSHLEGLKFAASP